MPPSPRNTFMAADQQQINFTWPDIEYHITTHSYQSGHVDCHMRTYIHQFLLCIEHNPANRHRPGHGGDHMSTHIDQPCQLRGHKPTLIHQWVTWRAIYLLIAISRAPTRTPHLIMSTSQAFIWPYAYQRHSLGHVDEFPTTQILQSCQPL